MWALWIPTQPLESDASHMICIMETCTVKLPSTISPTIKIRCPPTAHSPTHLSEPQFQTDLIWRRTFEFVLKGIHIAEGLEIPSSPFFVSFSLPLYPGFAIAMTRPIVYSFALGIFVCSTSLLSPYRPTQAETCNLFTTPKPSHSCRIYSSLWEVYLLQEWREYILYLMEII